MWHVMADWTLNIRYTAANVRDKVSLQGGNYTIRVKRGDILRIVYVGRAQNLQERLFAHLSPSEPNQYIRNHMENHIPYFQYLLVGTASERRQIEISLYNEHSPECNREPPT